MERAAYTKAQLDAYDRRKIDTMTLTSMISASKNEGLAEGEAIGLKKGETLGLEKGEVKGRTVEREQVTVNTFQMGLSIEKIAALTRLPTTQVAKILKTNGLM
jgi:predicted transposase YdaD